MSERGKVFVRDATGLVRNISGVDAFLASFAEVEIPLGLLTYTSAPYLFPGSNPVLATLIATGFSLFISAMYTLISWAMPRSAADYVFTSRILHPILGFIVSFNVAFWLIFFIGIYFNWVTTVALSPSILIIGTVTGNPGMVGFANLILQPTYTFVIGIVVLAIFMLVMVSGVRWTFRVTNILFLLSFVGYVIMIAVMLTSTKSTFIHNFNAFASYDNITKTAHAMGYSSQGTNPLYSTMGITPFIYLTTGFAIATSYYAGEVKSVKKNSLYSLVLVAVFSGVILAIFGALAIADFGYDFLGSAWFLSSAASPQYPFSIPPYFNLFVSLLTTNPTLLWLLSLIYLVGITAGIGPLLMMSSRTLFAWSFDRIIPTKFAEVNERLRNPLYIIVLIAALCVIDFVLYTFTPFLSFYSGATLGFVVAYAVVCVAAIIFPFTRREMFESSPAKIRIGGVPLISITGVGSLIFYLIMAYYLISNPLYGANVPTVYEVIGVIWLIPAAIFAASYLYHKSRGTNLLLIFKEIPPE